MTGQRNLARHALEPSVAHIPFRLEPPWSPRLEQARKERTEEIKYVIGQAEKEVHGKGLHELAPEEAPRLMWSLDEAAYIVDGEMDTDRFIRALRLAELAQIQGNHRVYATGAWRQEEIGAAVQDLLTPYLGGCARSFRTALRGRRILKAWLCGDLEAELDELADEIRFCELLEESTDMPPWSPDTLEAATEEPDAGIKRIIGVKNQPEA